MTYSSTILADNPIAYYHLDETVNLSTSGTTVANSGTAGGNAVISINGGHITSSAGAGTIGGSSFHFDNNGGFISQTPTFASTANLAIEFWYKWDTGYGTKPPVALEIANFGGNGHYVNFSLGATQNQILVQVGGTYVINKVITGVNPTDGNWHHIVITQSGAAMTVYIDAVSVATYASTSQTANTNANIQFGAITTNGGDCYIDEPAAYSTALTLAQVQAHYAAGTTVPATPVTVTPPVFNMGPLTEVAPAFVGVPLNDTVVVPPMTLSLTAPAASALIGATLTEAASAGSNGSSGNSFRFQYANYVGWKFSDVSIPAGKRIKSATLNVETVNSVAGSATATPGHVFGYQMDRYATAFNGSITGTHEFTGTITASSTPSVVTSIDVTSFVQDWASGSVNAGMKMTWIAAGSTVSTTEYVSFNDFSGHTASISVLFEDIPPIPVNVVAPVMTASLADPAPVVTAQKNVSSTAAIVDLGTVDLVAATSSATTNAITVVPVVAASLSFPGGSSFNPDYATTATAMTVGIATPNAKQFIEYNTVTQVPAIYFGNLENEPVTINLTTNRLTIVPPMSLSLKMVGIYSEQGDRYLAKLPSTLDADDLWYKMDEASGNRAIDSEFGVSYNPTLWTQSGYYVGNPTFRISDGPELRPATRFDGIDDYMLVGPYTVDDKWKDADSTPVVNEMAVTVEFSIRTTQENGVVFVGSGAGNSGLAAISPTYYSTPKISGAELRLENGYLVASTGAIKFKAREYIADGEWHYVVMAIPGGDFITNPSDIIQFDGRSPAYISVDGQPTLVRGTFGAWGENWLPYSVGARVTKFLDVDASGNPQRDPAANGFLAMDMRDFIVRTNTYQQLKTTEVMYYEWSNSTVLYPQPMTVNLSTVAPFKVKGNTKKMLALYGLPWGYGTDGYSQPIMTYRSTLSGMVIDTFAHLSSVTNGTTFNGFIARYSQAKTFQLGDYLVYPVDITGGRYADTTITSTAGVLDLSSAFQYEHLDGTGYGGFVDDSTGRQRFINLQEDLVNVKDFDVITTVNYPWEVPDATAAAQEHVYAGNASMYPNNGELCQGSMGLTHLEWQDARNALRDSILQAAYDGVNLWIGEYHMAYHLGFIQGYDVHDLGHITPDWNRHALKLDLAHGVTQYQGYLGLTGHMIDTPQKLVNRRIVNPIPGLTDLPTNEFGDFIQGWSIDRWKSNGDFTAYDIVKRPNGLQVGDLVRMTISGSTGGIQYSSLGRGIDIPFIQDGISYGYWNGSLYDESDVGANGANAVSSADLRFNVISAHPDGIAGTVVAREQLGHYGDNDVWVDNPYRDNVTTIAAEVGTVVRGRAIAGRAFIEMMETNITPTTIFEDQDKKPGQYAAENSTWDYDSRRVAQVLVKLTSSQINLIGGNLSLDTKFVNYMSFGDGHYIYRKRETMHNRGLNWLAQTPTINAGDAIVFQTAFRLTVTEPSATVAKTSNLTVQVSAMRLDMEVRQPRNYLSGDVTERTLPMEMFLDMHGRGAVVPAPVMTLNLSAVGAVARASTEVIPVFLDSDSGPITLFLKEDN